MKNLKNNNRILSYLICFSLLAFVNISCNENDDLESFIETSEKEKAAAKTMAKGNIKRTRMKERPNGLYKTVSVIKNNEENSQVSTIALQIEKQDAKTFILNLDKENKNARTFSFDEIKIEGEELVGKEITVNLTLLDSNQKQIGEIISETIIVAGPKVRSNYKRTRIKRRPNGMYRSSIVVNNDTDNTVSTVALEIESKKGLIPETKTYYLDYFTTIKGKKYYTYADIKFENPDVVNQEVNIKVTLLDADKKPISTSTGTTVIAGLSNANIKTGRTRMKQRPNGLYKMTAEIDNNEDNEVADVAISANDLQGNTTTFNVNPNKNNTINTNFSFEKESISEKMSVTYLLKDFYGDLINTFKEEVTLFTNLIGNPILTQNDDKKTFSLTIPLKRKQLGKDYKNLKIYVALKATNSTNYYEGTNFGFLEITRGLVIYENNNIVFKDLKNIAENKFYASITITHVDDLDDDDTVQAKNRRVTFQIIP